MKPILKMKKTLDTNTTGVEACDLQAGDVIISKCGQRVLRLRVSEVCNMKNDKGVPKTFVSFYNATCATFNPTDLIEDMERYIYA